MAVKAAKERFTRQDIIDILQQNVVLYKNEPEFVDYIVNLALYLIDQAYTVSGERSGDLESVIAEFQSARAARKSGLAPKLPAEAEADSFLPDEDDLDDGAPTTNRMKLQSYDAVMKAPPPPQTPDDDFDHPTASSQVTAKIAALGNVPEGERRPASSDIEDLSEADDEPKTRQLRSVGILTPDAEGGLTDRKSASSDRSPKISIGEDKGRARIYKVVRSYSASKGGDTNCPICGTDTKGSSRCPSCGHIM